MICEQFMLAVTVAWLQLVHHDVRVHNPLGIEIVKGGLAHTHSLSPYCVPHTCRHQTLL